MGRNDQPLPGGVERRDLRHAVTTHDPDRRAFYAAAVSAAWFALGVAALLAMLVVGIAVNVIVGDRAGDYVVDTLLAVGLFGCAGVFNALWRMYWHVPRARRQLRAHDGAESEEFARAMRRTLPGNSSLIFQTVVAILVFVLAL